MTRRDDEVRDFVADLVRIGTRELQATAGLDAQAADLAMRNVADAICVEYARRHIYVPIAYDPRNREIVRKYHEGSRSARACTPERIKELAAEYALTWRQIYSILRADHQADFAARQGVLPGLGDPV
jgi:Mor family transcriptional regulator